MGYWNIVLRIHCGLPQGLIISSISLYFPTYPPGWSRGWPLGQADDDYLEKNVQHDTPIQYCSVRFTLDGKRGLANLSLILNNILESHCQLQENTIGGGGGGRGGGGVLRGDGWRLWVSHQPPFWEGWVSPIHYLFSIILQYLLLPFHHVHYYKHSTSSLSGEQGQCVLSTQPKILFCDLKLSPGESKFCKCFTAAWCFLNMDAMYVRNLVILVFNSWM